MKKNQVPYPAQIESVQSAVDQFQKDNNGILPIKTREADTPIYRKYPIDFNRLIPRYLQDAPGTAFESGGVYQYVLVDVENQPKVKLIDLRVVDVIRELNLRINFYRQENKFPPFKGTLATNRFTIDYDKLGYEEPPYVVSPYSGNNLPLMIDGEGTIFIDYSIDLYKLLQETPHQYKFGDDIRELLVNNSVFVPAYSVPYTVENNEPVFLKD